MNQGQFEHGGNIHALRRNQQISAQPFWDFSANINPLGLADSVRKAIIDTLDWVIHYPEPNSGELKNALATYYQIDSASLTLGNGAVELLYTLCHILKPRQVLIPAPSFSEYERAARSANAAIKYFPLKKETGFAIDPAAIIQELPQSDICFIGNPNNPTGTLLHTTELEKILIAAQKNNCLVVMDESFMDFVSDAKMYTCRDLLTKYENLFLLQSLTKFYAIPGLRLGFAACNNKLAVKLHAAKDPWNVNVLAQAAGIAALADTSYQEATRQTVFKNARELENALKKLPYLTIYPPSVNFILAEIHDSLFSAANLKNELHKRRIIIRDCVHYPGLSSAFFRVAVRSAEENLVLLENLKTIWE